MHNNKNLFEKLYEKYYFTDGKRIKMIAHEILKRNKIYIFDQDDCEIFIYNAIKTIYYKQNIDFSQHKYVRKLILLNCIQQAIGLIRNYNCNRRKMICECTTNHEMYDQISDNVDLESTLHNKIDYEIAFNKILKIAYQNSKRAYEILKYLSMGYKLNEISKILNTSEESIKNSLRYFKKAYIQDKNLVLPLYKKI